MSLTLPDWFWVSARSRVSEYPHQAPVAEENYVWRNSECGVHGSGKWADQCEQCVHIAAWVTWYNTGLSPGQINTDPWKPSRHPYFQNKLGPERRERAVHAAICNVSKYYYQIYSYLTRPCSACLAVVGSGEWYQILDGRCANMIQISNSQKSYYHHHFTGRSIRNSAEREWK